MHSYRVHLKGFQALPEMNTPLVDSAKRPPPMSPPKCLPVTGAENSQCGWLEITGALRQLPEGNYARDGPVEFTTEVRRSGR